MKELKASRGAVKRPLPAGVQLTEPWAWTAVKARKEAAKMDCFGDGIS